MFVGKALSLICYCYPASERGSKLARGWNSFSPWGDSGPSTREGGTRVSIFYKIYLLCDKASYGLTRRWLEPSVWDNY